jgi:5,10-methylene-tetrahydrofolate dehydrogenase/methenyl tetrahydrofolate cyclohydrolase
MLRRFSFSFTKKAIYLDGLAVAKIVQNKICKDVEEAMKSHSEHLDLIQKQQQQKQQQIGPLRPCRLCDSLDDRHNHHKYRGKPCLAMVVVGDDTAPTMVYLKNKERAALACGFESKTLHFPRDITQESLEQEIVRLEQDPTVHGIIVQRPLPPHLNPVAASSSVSPIKDVDGLHPSNIGLLHSRNSNPIHVPCTAMAVMRLLRHYKVPIVGKRAVILGASNIAGRPISELLLTEGATVTTLGRINKKIIETIVRKADILVTACGERGLIHGDMVKPGAAVVDVGLSPIRDDTRPNGFRLVGDVDFESVVKVAGWITPVPGGVGPMTVSMLMENTVRAYQLCIDGHTSKELIKAAERLWTNASDESNVASSSNAEAGGEGENDADDVLNLRNSKQICDDPTLTVNTRMFSRKNTPREEDKNNNNHHHQSEGKSNFKFPTQKATSTRAVGPSPTSL